LRVPGLLWTFWQELGAFAIAFAQALGVAWTLRKIELARLSDGVGILTFVFYSNNLFLLWALFL
jgi:hypothetical protein|tara:strand:- start:1367 stop:1558 length:192 start_codon:yes stop_codon:yes gene_type:complete